MKHLLFIYLVLAIFGTGDSVLAQNLPDCLCGRLPKRLPGDVIWFGTAGKKSGTTQEFAVKELVLGKDPVTSTKIEMPPSSTYQDSLEEGRDYVIVIKNPKAPKFVACQTVNILPYYERRGRAYPGPNNPVECLGVGYKHAPVQTKNMISIPEMKQKTVDWSFKDERDPERNSVYFSVWKDKPGEGPRDGILNSVAKFEHGRQVGPILSYSSAKEEWDGIEPKLGPSVEMKRDSDVQVMHKLSKSLTGTMGLWRSKDRTAFVGLAGDLRFQLVPSLSFGSSSCPYHAYGCDVSSVRLSAFLGKRKGAAIDFNGGGYGMFTDILGVGARVDEELGAGPMISMELGIAMVMMMVRGTWFVTTNKAEADLGLSFMLPILRSKR